MFVSRGASGIDQLFSKVIVNRFRLYSGDDRRQCSRVCLLHRLQAAEVLQKTPSRTLAYAGDL